MKLEAMAAEEQKNVLDEDSTSEGLSDGELFKDDAHDGKPRADIDQSDLAIHQELSEYDLFAGDEDFYNLLAESSPRRQLSNPTPHPSPLKYWSGRNVFQAFRRCSLSVFLLSCRCFCMCY